MNPEEAIPKDLPDEAAGDRGDESEGKDGYSVVINCHADGSHDVFRTPLQPASEQDHPDGMFGLESLEDALKAVIALKRQGPDYASMEEHGMMQGYGGGANDADSAA